MMILLEGKNCYLRILIEEDAEQFTQMLKANKTYWTIFEPMQEPPFYTVSVQREKIREALYQMRDRREYNFGIFDMITGQLIGHISLYSIKRLPFLSGYIGYSIDEGEIGRGIATEAVKLATQFAFDTLRLNRLEAYVSPRNTGSVAVLEKSGYTQEGLLRQKLYINGAWEDHYMYAKLYNDLP